VRRLAGLAVLLLLGIAAAPAARAQSARELQESRQRLADIKAERERLQRQQERLQGQVHDVEDELDNIERQKQSTSRIVLEIERQIGGLTSQLDQASAELVLAQDNLAERKAVLERRLVDIYKRGPLHTWKVLLTAESFGDLLRRYKYLFLTSEQDRALVSDVERLRDRVSRQRGEIVMVKDQLDATRVEREQELNQYNRLADAREKRLGTLQRSARANAARLVQLEKDATRLNNVLAALEKAARAEAARSRASGTRTAPIPGALTTASLGRLDWPVEGRIVYQFGRDTLPQGGVIRWNGIGIAATPGTPVHAVEAGRVRLVETMGTYGLTVILEHGNGYYSIYSHLQGAAVKAGDDVKKGQILGAVGGENSDYGPHLHFEIRGENQMAMDPLDWLRRR
jgi:septal ring factor EnvC (AmiA/AmiB activator)